MTTSKDEALRLALEALEWFTAAEQGDEPPINKTITAIKQALEETQSVSPEPETYWRDMAFAHLGVSRDKMPDEQVTAVQDWLHGVYTSRPKAKDEKGRPMTFWGGMEQPEPEPVATNDTSQDRVDKTAKQRHEPVAWLSDDGNVLFGQGPKGKYTKPLYTSPPKRKWQGLTDEEIDQGLVRTNYAMQTAGAWRDGVEWAINQLKEKNT